MVGDFDYDDQQFLITDLVEYPMLPRTKSVRPCWCLSKLRKLRLRDVVLYTAFFAAQNQVNSVACAKACE